MAVVAHHVAGAHKNILGLAQMGAAGQQAPTVTPEMIEQGNVLHAEKHANATREETLHLLRANGAAAVSAIRGFNDEALARPTQYGTTQQLLEHVLIGHAAEHLHSIRSALDV